ncbi:hypothetical protein [Aeromonas dhakensis]|uniref:hypothetical protein n=1 Tax=Aeromonas dhakensis TaxID=196024 RepID=UPI0007ED1B0E|nr:hypothetical protein [Aeromonas dhakensis]OBR43882.1 hypothetical protein A9196_07050 [Aeromonas dhakensis]
MKIINAVRKYAAPVAVVASAAVASSSAFAVDIATEFAAAKTQAEANVDLVVVGVVALALLTFGVGALLSWARK